VIKFVFLWTDMARDKKDRVATDREINRVEVHGGEG